MKTDGDRREMAALLDWTRDQLQWLAEDGYEEQRTIVLRASFSLWYVKPATAMVSIWVDRFRGGTEIRLGPDSGVDPVYARVVGLRRVLAARGVAVSDVGPHVGAVDEARAVLAVLLDALTRCRDVELAGRWEHFEEAIPRA